MKLLFELLDGFGLTVREKLSVRLKDWVDAENVESEGGVGDRF